MLRTVNSQTGEITDSAPLSESEKADLARCEADIQQGAYQTWRALREINAKALYREYGTFETYCEQKWGITSRRGYQLIDAADLVDDLCTIGSQIEIPNERVARAVLELPVEERLPVLLDAHVASGGHLDSGWIKDAATVRAQAQTTHGYVDNGDGGMAEKHAAITEERHERMQRQRQHIRDGKDKDKADAGLSKLFEGYVNYHSHNKSIGTLTAFLPRETLAHFDGVKPGKALWIVIYITNEDEPS